jgi:phosphomannomutase/phosphoglucomutase
MKEYAHKKKYKTTELDGVRIEFENGWGLIRFSNTSPNLTLRYEANSNENLKLIMNELDGEVNKLLKTVKE